MKNLSILGAAACLALGACATHSPVIRHPNAAANSPTSRAVEVSAGNTFVFVSGQTPAPARPQAAEFSAEYWGDTKAQTISVLRKVEEQLKSVGLGMGDVVKMQVFLVGDPALGGRADAQGYAEGYAQFFGTAAQPNRPARTTVTIAALGRPNMLVEIDVIAVRP